MQSKELKIFGGFRTGTNLVRSLLELNYDVVVHNNNYAYKHIPVPADFRENSYKPFPLGIISVVKDPFAFLDSVFRYCKSNNFLNIDAGREFDEFCYQRFIVFDGGFKQFPRYRFSNPVQYWNSIYSNLYSLPEKQNIFLRYENLLEDMEGEIRKVAEKYDLTARTKKFVHPTGVTINLGDPERSANEDYFKAEAFSRKKYYLERQYMERFTDEQKHFIYSELDQDLLQALSYPQNIPVLETQNRKTSFVNDLQQLVVLVQESIPQLKIRLAAEQKASLELKQQLELSRASIKFLERESKIMQETRNNWESEISTLKDRLAEQKATSTAAHKELSDDLNTARNQISSLLEHTIGQASQLTEAHTKIESQREDLRFSDQQIEILGSQLAESQAAFHASRQDMASGKKVLETTRQELATVSQNLKVLEKELEKTNVELDRAKSNYNHVKSDLKNVRESFSFKLGYDLVHAIIRPGKNTLLFPVRLIRNIRDKFLKNPTSGTQTSQGITVDQRARPAVVNEGPIGADKFAKHIQAREEQSIKKISELNVACIFDEFTTEGYLGECNLMPVPLHGWKDTFSANPPDLLFVESAWRGNGGQWEYKVGKYAGQDGSELKTLIKWCNDHGIPTVFWNKEDPVHYDKFIESARQFDLIFTTDDGRISSYREAAGHDQVYSLQFSAQPRLHNPIRTVEVEDKVCFAGSYYRNLHDTRRDEMNEILDIAKSYGLVIYDRNYERNCKGETEFSFPERFRENIAGSLPYNQMDLAYKGYKYCLNVNSISDSKTMFSRRVFESLACGTPVLSTWSRGIEETFGDLVLMTGKDFSEDEILEKLHVSGDDYRKIAAQGIRHVYEHHLYKHRFATVLNNAGIQYECDTGISITLIGVAQNPEEAERIISQFKRQAFQMKKLLLLLNFTSGVEKFLNDREKNQDRVTIFHLGSAQVLGYALGELVATTHIAFIDPENFHGEFFLTDLAHAAIYAGAQVIGKATFFNREDGHLNIVDGGEFQFTESVLRSSSIVKSNLVESVLLDDVTTVFCMEQFNADSFDQPVKYFSVNRLNFIKSAYSIEQGDLENLISQVEA